MKKRDCILIGMITLTAIMFGCNQNAPTHETIVISNETFTKKIHVSATKPAGIFVEYYDSSDVMLASTTPLLPFFEFYLNNEHISSNDPVWLKTAFTQRKMQNGGTEYSLMFSGVKGQVEGLEVNILQQKFPNSTIIREKLSINAIDSHIFHLTKHKDKLVFRFPQYCLLSKHNNEISTTEFRLASWELKPITFGNKQEHSLHNEAKYNHMFYPNILSHNLSKNQRISVKGPISVTSNGVYSWLTAYEHASQDNLNGIVQGDKAEQDALKNVDPLQGTIGVFNFPKQDDDFKFIDIQYLNRGDSTNVSVNLKRGAYLDGEVIDAEHPYSTVWSATAFYVGDDTRKAKSIIQQYLLEQICEKPASRKPEFYYNTWGMQREVSSRNPKKLRDVLTYDRIFAEIEYAAELGVDLFVLDDGWEQKQGVWTPHKERLPQGLAPIKQKLDEHGMKMGLWFSPAGIDTTAQRYKEHPEWVILDSEKNPIKAQWGHPAFDMVSDFFDVFVDDCKKLIDEGALFFKWDAINTFYSSLPDLHHGSEKYSEQELRERYAYLLPIYITRAMEILTEYEPELIIEIDVTEARRVMMGLAPLSQGKLFFMNNGASGYNDYSAYRTMSMRTIPNEYGGIIPLELFTYANYPHNLENSMHYNVNTSLISGHGFWGNLELMSKAERLEVGKKVGKSKRVLPYIADISPVIEGNVGDPLEVYAQINHEESAGQIIIFNTEPYTLEKNIPVNTSKFLAVLNQPYRLVSDTLNVNFQDKKTWSTNEVFILPNTGIDIFINSSTCILDDVNVEEGKLDYMAKGSGQQSIIWNNKYGYPQISDDENIEYVVDKREEYTTIKVTTTSMTPVKITAQ